MQILGFMYHPDRSKECSKLLVECHVTNYSFNLPVIRYLFHHLSKSFSNSPILLIRIFLNLKCLILI